MPLSPQRVWEIVGDPGAMPSWWPGVERVEGIEAERFTLVFRSRRGRPVRMDFHHVAVEPPWRRAWAQDVVGTPFERVLTECVFEVALSSVDAGTRVTLAERQRLKGYSRTGGLLLGRASARRLDEALVELERVCRSSAEGA